MGKRRHSAPEPAGPTGKGRSRVVHLDLLCSPVRVHTPLKGIPLRSLPYCGQRVAPRRTILLDDVTCTRCRRLADGPPTNPVPYRMQIVMMLRHTRGDPRHREAMVQAGRHYLAGIDRERKSARSWLECLRELRQDALEAVQAGETRKGASRSTGGPGRTRKPRARRSRAGEPRERPSRRRRARPERPYPFGWASRTRRARWRSS